MKQFLNDIKLIQQIRVTKIVNGLLYYVKKIPILKAHISDDIYCAYTLKKVVSVFAIIIQILVSSLKKAFYVFVCLVLPIVLIYQLKDGEINLPAVLYLFMILSGLLGPIYLSKIINPTIEDFIMIRQMKMNTKRFLFAKVSYLLLVDTIFLCLMFIIFFLFFDQPVWYTIPLLLMYVGMHLIGDMVHVYVYDKYRVFVMQSFKILVPYMLVLLAVAFGPIIFRLDLTFLANILLIILSISAILFGFLAYRYLMKFPNYFSTVNDAFMFNDAAINMNETRKKAMFSDVELKEKDYQATELLSGKNEGKKGYEYLNRIFFQRNKRLIMKPLLRRLKVIGGAFVVIMLIAYFVKSSLPKTPHVYTLLAPTIFMMYFLSIGERVSRAMFMNCDVSLLHYGYYRQPKAIISNFLIRCRLLCVYNLGIALVLCVALDIVFFYLGVSFTLIELGLFNICILALSIFFSVHYLFIYYIFQPYNEQFDMKNPFMYIINSIVYIVCYASAQMKGSMLLVAIIL